MARRSKKKSKNKRKVTKKHKKRKNSSIKKKERRLIAVASGFETKNDRSKQSLKLLTWGLTKFETIKIGEKNKTFSSIDV